MPAAGPETLEDRQSPSFDSSSHIIAYTQKPNPGANNANPASTHHVDSGNLRNISISLSAGVASMPTAVSYGGRSGADGWLRVGTKCLVRSKLRASAPDASAPMACSSAGRSSRSSSVMCCVRDSHRESMAGMKDGSVGGRDWKVYSFSLTCCRRRRRH